MPAIEINATLESKKNMTRSMAVFFLVIELAGLAVLFFALYQLRIAYEFNHELDFMTIASPRFGQYAIFFAISMAVYMFLIYKYNIYHFRMSSGYANELFSAVKAYSIAILIAIGASFLLKYDDFSRLVIVSYWAISIAYTALVRMGKRKLYFQMAKQAIVGRNVLIVGAGKVGKSLMDELFSNTWLGYRVVGYVDDSASPRYKLASHLGSTRDILNLIKRYSVDEIIITIPSERDLVNHLITDLRKLDIKIKIIPDMFNLMMSTVQIGNINALPVVTLVKTPMRGLGLVYKRGFDILASSFLILLIFPVFVLTAIAIKMDSRGPVLYRQTRIGRNGKPFEMLKFRSMIANADAMLQSIGKKNDMDGLAFKLKNDPRVTRLGRFLRKYSIDELPQLFNVLIGNMSLVGPRPPLPREVEKYGDWEWRRLEVTPGITGLWQVSGRSNLSFQQWMNLDIYYIENWSFTLDLKILLKTIPVVIKGEGAY